MLRRFMPKEMNFFDLFEKQVDCVIEGSRYFREITENGIVDDAVLHKMHQIEHKGDDIAHDIMDQLNKTFITPFDREDIHTLTKEIDDIIDMLYTIVNRMKIYKFRETNKDLVEFSKVIERSAKGVSCAVRGLRNMKNTKSIMDSCVEINSLENVGDTLRDKLLGELFEKEKDPITIIKLKEIYQDAETVLDICEDVAHIVGNILVKQA